MRHILKKLKKKYLILLRKAIKKDCLILKTTPQYLLLSRIQLNTPVRLIYN